MQAVILAGGLGTRLRPVTETSPKPMVLVAGVPYLEHQLLLLKKQSIRDGLILTGYLGMHIEEYFGDGSRLGLCLRYSREPMPLGTGGALRHASALLDETFLIIYGDSYLPIDYSVALQILTDSTATGLVVAYDNSIEATSVQNNLALDSEGFVTQYAKESARESNLLFVEAGVLAFRKKVLDLIPPNRQISLEQQIFPELIAHRNLIAYKTKQRFYDIGTFDRIRVLEAYLLDGNHANAFSR